MKLNTTQKSDSNVRLTEYSHGAGCGCKLSPAVLTDILKSFKQKLPPHFAGLNMSAGLLVGTETGDDAAVYQIDDQNAIISTTDFFMPIVDDPFEFGRIAATNALSDVYAMGGRPLMAVSILGWPIDKLPASVAGAVVEGAQSACTEAGISIAGGHSINCPEPIFGLAVTGHVKPEKVLTNAGAKDGDLIYLTKPLGIGVLSTAQKQKKLKPDHANLATSWMCKLNDIGYKLAQNGLLSAMTDVTGFGLAGHLLEVCHASKLQAAIKLDAIPVLEPVKEYIENGCIPGGTRRNFDSYGHSINNELSETDRDILCDPQTSGGLLLFVKPQNRTALEDFLHRHKVQIHTIGQMKAADISGLNVI